MRVGAFELDRKIGAGGMGEIWMARHLEQGVPAAVKFDLHPPDDTWREAFLAEVRRIAELDHPNVVHLFDTGLVTAAEARAAGGFIAEGMPWLAMELARGGSVADAGNTPTDWTGLLHLATGLLRALSHAHARGIVHRDIKPGNLLLAGPRSSFVATPDDLLEARVVLSDFGIGHDRDRPGWMDEQSVGTPRFMAPEQIEANWRDQGPWTDLYQTGIMLWRLATGRYPYEQKKAVQLYRAHLLSPLPDFEPSMDVPAGLEALLRRMLEKDWRKRPAFCSDVLEELESLGPPVLGSGGVPVGMALEIEDSEAPTLVESLSATTAGRTQPSLGPQVAFVLDLGLRGAGLGLWGLRPPPLVDRDAERKALWAALGDVASSGEPAAVVLRGPPGVGKSRLAQWVALEGNERGRCHVLRVAHHAVPDDDHGLPGMFRRELRLGGLPREEAVQRIRDHLDLDDGSLDLLATWVLGVARPEDREPSATEKLSLLRRCLAHWAADRPVLVLVDDAHYGAIALRLVSALVRRVRKLPVLFVFALRDDLLVQRPEESRRVDDLLQGPRTSALAVAPLGEDHQRELVRKMLGLEGSLAAEVERRTAGNPAFAVQLVNAWVRSGELEVGPAGFRLKHGLPDDLPSDLLAVWTERVASLAEELPFEDMEAFELAAMLGVDVEVRAWRDVCARAGIRLRPGLIGRLVRTYLLKADPRMERVTFAHNGVREALLLRLRAMGREARSAGFAADYLLAHGGDPGRTAELLLASDRLDDATEPLLAIIEDELAQGDLRSSRWLELLEGVLRDLGVPSTDERWGTLWLNWAWLFRLQGKREEADQLAARTEKAARRHGWKAVLGWALSEAGATALDRAEYAEAISFLEEAEGVLREAGRPESAAHCRNRIAVAWESLGRFDRAEQSFRSCLNAFVDNPKSWVFAATPWLGLAQLYQKQGRLDEALDHAAQARVWSERMGQHANLALIELLEGEVARYRGDLVGADDHYRRSAEIYETFHHPMSTVATLNLAVVGVLRGQFAETRAMTESLLASLLEADRRPAFAAYARSVLLACTAALGDQAAFDVHHRELSAFLEATGAAEPDIAKLASIAANRAQTASMQDRALAIQRQQEKRLEKKA